MCNRSDQEFELGPALRRHQSDTPRRPFLCVVHGDQDECHSEFIKRLQHDIIPRLLNLKVRGLSVEHYTLPWPSQIRSGAADAASVFHGLLGLSICHINEKAIDSLFDRRDLCTRGGHISMQVLADELENLVVRYRH